MDYMLKSTLKGLCFGLTSGIITTLGLIVGLNSFAGSKMVLIGGILTIAVADSFSDALGIHISEESEESSHEKVWISTIATFVSKLIFSSTFIIPVLFLENSIAIIVSVVWGLLALGVLSYFIAKEQKNNPFKVIGEHLLIAVIVIVLTHYIGRWIATVFV